MINGYYSDEVPVESVSLDFHKCKGSMSHRFRIGPNSVPEQAYRGRLVFRKGFCACSSCHAPNFDFVRCQFTALFGRCRQEECPPLKPVRGALPAVVEIPEFAATLKAGDFRAVDVTQHQVINKEHSFNNCNELICLYESGGPRRCSLLALPPHGICFSDQCTLIFSGETFDEGYYLVKIHWLEFVNVDSANQRRYRIGEERMLSVHSLVRFRALKLTETSAAANRGRGHTSAPNKLLLLPAAECGLISERTEMQENF